MSDPATLLPPSSTPLERALSRAMGRFNPPSVIPTLWNPDTCPISVLPYLAWALSVDEWDEAWSIEKKREVVKEARGIHQKKGTLSAIRRALASVGQPDAEIIERADLIRCDGSVICDGTHSCGGEWATRRVVLKRPVTIDQAFLIKRLIGAVGRNCVHLLSVRFDASAFRCDGTITCNGAYSCGTVNTTIN
ncbi:MAG TPA: phage tail protein I [Rhodocyclaceae bacterium]|nr:phage tail protein I [Rhodocyclaceae bacterium]